MKRNKYREKEPYFSGFSDLPDDVKTRLFPDGLPFYNVHVPPVSTICVCLHGFPATPFEIRPVADACFSEGMDTVAPLLPCHGYANPAEQHEHIVRMTASNVIDAVRAEIARSRQKYPRVFVYGQSFGGALALLMAEEGLVDACATTAPAIKLPLGVDLAAIFLGRFDVNIKKKARKAFYNIGYSFNNSIAGRAVHSIALQARGHLDCITCPVLVCHSHTDSTVSYVVPGWVKQRSRGPVEIAWFDNSPHSMPLGAQGKEISETICGFFTRQIVASEADAEHRQRDR